VGITAPLEKRFTNFTTRNKEHLGDGFTKDNFIALDDHV